MPILFIAFSSQLAIGQTVVSQGPETTVDFEREIAPIFRERCLRCHRPGNAKSDMSLATIDRLRENDYIIDGDADSSYLVELITSIDGEPPEMPHEGDPLTVQQVDLIRQWIDQGSDWPQGFEIKHQSKGGPDWWAFQPLVEKHPTTSQASIVDQAGTIDSYVDRNLAQQGLKRSSPTDRVTLIRRATFDLIGLPPTPDEVEAFVGDESVDAYEKLIDRLLASPHYGERWGRHWLDVVRFGESIGFERNGIINNLWPFRDYVIDSLNCDKPFDRMIREHLAGDALTPGDPEAIIGSAFLVAGPYDNVGNQDLVQKAQIRANTIDEMIRATSEAFLGLTIGCARCHDHKFDPVTQSDYYSLYASLAGVVHGSASSASAEQIATRMSKINPLNQKKSDLEKQLADLRASVLKRAQENSQQFIDKWTRPPVDRTGTTETFPTITARFVRLVCESQDINPAASSGFRIDEFQIWSDESEPRNVALTSNGGKAFGKSRQIEDFPNAYGPQLAIDGKTGARFLATGKDLRIELVTPTPINRVVFSSAIGEPIPDHRKFVFVADYRIEVSEDGSRWTEVANGRDRKPARTAGPPDGRAHREHRLMQLTITEDEKARRKSLNADLAAANRGIASIPPLPTVWIGTRNAELAKGPFHVFLGGSPQKHGDQVVPHSLSVFDSQSQLIPNSQSESAAIDGSSRDHGATETQPFPYRLESGVSESQRRLALARWITHPDNPITPRVLANRIWHYHFGTGIVSTPSDFGYMGGTPSHPELLDYLAIQLQHSGWRIKPLHRMIMLSETYRQGSKLRSKAALIDADSRLLWRFPPRRIAAEEIRDTVLQVSGVWKRTSILENSESAGATLKAVPDGGPGFRLYQYLEDNVSTYKPLDQHGPETYRRAVYHQNARASVVDLMTDFDQPDCAFSTPRRTKTTTPLQALTMLNHRFTLDMADAMAKRLQLSDSNIDHQIQHAFRLCYSRTASPTELIDCRDLTDKHGLPAFCRAMLNTSELIYVK